MLEVIVPIAIVVGIAVGALVLGLMTRRLINSARVAAASDRDAAIRLATEQVTTLAGERLSAQATLGAQQVASDRELVQRQVAAVGDQLEQVRTAMTGLEAARAAQHATLSEQIRSVAEQSAALQGTTASLKAALASPQARGQWGERMAEDVLRAAGMIEGVNYHKRKQAPGGTGIPDFAFPLPNGLRLNMDVKFPLANYLRYLDAGSDPERQEALKAFLRDVRGRVKEVTEREYIDPANGTADCVLLLIPNEQVHAFIHTNAPGVIDEAMAQRVILCSPVGLIGVLAVIRQAADSFAFQQAARDVLDLLAAFAKQWGMFLEGLERLGKRLDAAHEEYEKLTSTRRRQIDRVLLRIEDLRSQPTLALPEPATLDLTGDAGSGEEEEG
ncbi:MAG: DNA recombination protein RmuC [Acidimicrobiia bacterium]|nr:DNA recombination protein RmuC [Acidimicrobiia bacterium]